MKNYRHSNFIRSLIVFTFILGVSITILTKEINAREDHCDVITDSEETGKWGFIDHTGTFAIKPQFKWVSDFSEGLAVVAGEKGEGYIDKTGKVVIPPRFFEAGPFSGGIALVRVDDRCGYINKIGEYIINPHYIEAGNFSEGLAPVRIGEKWGFIDANENVVIKPQFDSAKSFSGGLAQIERDGKYGYIDKTGRLVIDYKFDIAGDFREGLACVLVQRGKGKFMYINQTGTKTIEREFDSAAGFSDGLANVSKIRLLLVILLTMDDDHFYNELGYIDKTGKLVLKKPVGSGSADFSEGLTWRALKESQKWAFIDKTGQKKFEIEAYSVKNFSDGLARVRFLN